MAVLTSLSHAAAAKADQEIRFKVTFDRGTDLGQNFGSLFEAKSNDGSLVIGAGFQNAYNTYYRADRHTVQFFIRPADLDRRLTVETLPRPNDLCGTYVYARDDVVRSVYGGVKAWDAERKVWRDEQEIGGTQETMRVGRGVLEFGNSEVRYDGRTILSKPERGSYHLFFYANGYLCFYYIDRGEGGYRPFQNEADGFSKLYACPWTHDEDAVDLGKAIVLNLPIVGETTFAWGQSGRQIITGSNVGGFYILEDGRWQKLLEPKLNVSFQFYSTMALADRIVLGQYPTGRLFEFHGKSLTELPDWPPLLSGVSGSAREAQTTVVYGGEMFAGVWPWGELWRYHPDAKRWTFQQRMFDHPELSAAIVHPYDVENKGYDVGNLWGQRVTSLVTSGANLFVSTSAKSPVAWEPERFPFLAPDKWKSYGAVHRLTMPGHLGANIAWTNGPTTLEFTLRDAEMTIIQDGRKIATTAVAEPLAGKLRPLPEFESISVGAGLYGKFGGKMIEGAVQR